MKHQKINEKQYVRIVMAALFLKVLSRSENLEFTVEKTLLNGRDSVKKDIMYLDSILRKALV